MAIIKTHRTTVTRERTSKQALTITQNTIETASLYQTVHKLLKTGTTSSDSRRINLKMQMTNLLQILPKTNPKTRRKMRRRETSQTRMMTMRTKETLRRSKRSPRNPGTFHHEGYPIHLRRLLKNKNSSCRPGKTPWLSIQIFPKIGSSRTSPSP